MIELRSLGRKAVVTNADRPETIDWYKRKLGYREIGSLEKVHEFGDPGTFHLRSRRTSSHGSASSMSRRWRTDSVAPLI